MDLTLEPIDYSRSFICHSASFNSVRFWIESRTVVVDYRGSGRRTDYYQCASCKSEHTFAEANLFHEDNYDFLPIFGDDKVLIFRRFARVSERYRQIARQEELWGRPILKLRPANRFELITWSEISRATMSGLPMIAQTEIEDPDTGLCAVLEYPVKTMNLSPERRMYQVDTGPVALPDLRRQDDWLEGLVLAYVAFNTPAYACFVTEQPTPLEVDGAGACSVYHYSNPYCRGATNRLFALKPESPSS